MIMKDYTKESNISN